MAAFDAGTFRAVVVRIGPTRTCIGCRQRSSAKELLRVVVTSEPALGDLPVVVPDPRHRMPGRGAWVHPEPACVELAQRRRAFARALRVPATTDPGAVHEYVMNYSSTDQRTETGIPAGGTRVGDNEQ